MTNDEGMGKVQEAILEMIAVRGPGRTICPSEVARHLCPDDWRPLMPVVRQAADSLRIAGRLRITQGGADVDLRTVRGPIRLGL